MHTPIRFRTNGYLCGVILQKDIIMARIYKQLTELIGHTPLMELCRIEKEHGLQATVIVKMESFNPGGSAKDRVALAMIEDAERKGLLQPGGTIIEPTSGNTGVGLAWIAIVKGYRTILTMPETMSVERQKLLKAMGAQVVLTEGSKGMQGAVDKAEELNKQLEGSVILGQFTNPANPAAHVQTTAEEIWEDTDGKVDIFVAGVGTGGTISGVAEGLKRHNPNIVAVGVEPDASPVLSGGKAGPHKIQGIGANFIPDTYNASKVDEVIRVKDEEAIRTGRELSATEGVLAGISSGASLHAALELAKRPENKGKMIVVLLPDTGERYLSTELFEFK